MKIVFSRKGFDSANGGRASPIINGRPQSLPIPEGTDATSTYGDLGLGELVEKITRGKLTGADGCHDDPMFAESFCWFGQSGSAQGHLRKQRVGIGDVLMFFGLFADPKTNERHHRIYAYMKIAGFGRAEDVLTMPLWREPARPHPHLSAKPRRQNTVYFGPAKVARHASDALRLTRPGGPTSRWTIPEWLMANRPTYLKGDSRRIDETTLDTRGIWQEGVCHIGDAAEPRRWLDGIIAEIERE